MLIIAFQVSDLDTARVYKYSCYFNLVFWDFSIFKPKNQMSYSDFNLKQVKEQFQLNLIDV